MVSETDEVTYFMTFSTSHWCSITCYEKSVNVSDEILVHFDTPVVHIHGNEESIKDMIEAEDYRYFSVLTPNFSLVLNYQYAN